MYISIIPLKWSWAFTIKEAQYKSLSAYNPKNMRNNIPIQLYTLKKQKGIDHRNWKLIRDTIFLGKYYAVPLYETGEWEIIKVE